jgi:hypothetical protein
VRVALIDILEVIDAACNCNRSAQREASNAEEDK